MGAGRKTEQVTVQEKLPKQQSSNIQPWSARNMRKKDLAGVIFACKYSTYKECFSKLLFGLPGAHFAYVQNVTVGMPLFLFNVTDRKLHGIYEAASPGQMAIDKNAWTSDGSEMTSFPAQVRVKIRMQCRALVEGQFKPIIAKNYLKHDPHFFWFELDQGQTQQLISLFSASPISRSVPKPLTTVKWGNLFKKSIVPISHQGSSSKTTNAQMLDESSYDPEKPWSSLFKAQEQGQDPALEEKSEKSEEESLCTMSEDETPVSPDASCENAESFEIPEEIHPSAVSSEATYLSDQEMSSEENFDICVLFNKLLQTLGEIKELQLTQTQKIESLDLELAEVKSRLQNVESQRGEISSSSYASSEDCSESILIVGGYNGSSWLQDFVSYLPSEDLMQPLEPKSSIHPYASALEFNGDVYVLGGGHGDSWYDTVESYSLRDHTWVSCPALNTKKGSLAGASLLDKIFAIGGGNEAGCLSEVEMLDFNVGKWLVTRSMLHKRFVPAAAELNGALYVAGGYDGQEYLRSLERFDPREHSWTQLKPMSARRGCHSLTVLDDKLYAIGGYDGDKMVSTVEVFDPRAVSWTMSESMTTARGYMGAAALGNTIYVMGGMLESGEIIDTVECFTDGEGWRLAKSKFIGGRCFFSAVACTLWCDQD